MEEIMKVVIPEGVTEIRMILEKASGDAIVDKKAEFSQRGEGLEKQIADVLTMIGIPAHIKGYFYITEALKMLLECPGIIHKVTKVIYPNVAKTSDSTSSGVERSIRHAIEVAWDRGDVSMLNEMFGNTIKPNKGKPTNSEFLGLVAKNLRLHR